MLGVSAKTVRRLVEAGSLAEPLRIGGAIRWDPVDVDEFKVFVKITARLNRCQEKKKGQGIPCEGQEGTKRPKSQSG